MENKEVEKMLDSIKCEYALLEGKLYYQSKDVERLLKDNQRLTKEKRMLEQQLKAKDKALDRACEAVSRGSEGRYVEPKEELKEYFEHVEA